MMGDKKQARPVTVVLERPFVRGQIAAALAPHVGFTRYEGHDG